MHILLVDDDPIGSRMIKFVLGEEGYEIEAVDGPRAALVALEKHIPDLLLLDVNMPFANGFDLYKRLKHADFDIPAIFVTAKGELEDRLQGLRLGADDYIVKPFQPAELLARVEAVLRRYRKARATAPQVLRVGEFEVSASEMCVTLPDRRTVFLTPTELKVLLYLMQRAGQVVAREDVMERVWGEGEVGESNIVDVYIRRLRKKIERDATNPVHIQAARGVGYRFVAK